jgi:hypothetical protein
MFRFCLSPGGFVDLVYREENDTSIPLAFWLKPVSNFGLLVMTGFINSSLMLTMHPRLVPYRVLLSVMPSASRLRRVGYIVRRASDHILVACLRSLRLKVQPVCLMALSVISNNHHCDFVSRSSIHPFFPITFQVVILSVFSARYFLIRSPKQAKSALNHRLLTNLG